MLSKIIVLASLLLILAVSISGYFIYQNNLKEIESVTWEYWKKGDERRGGRVIQNSIKENRRKEYVITKYDIQKSITTVILKRETLVDGKQDIQFETFYLERTGINSFKVNESVASYSTSYTFEEAINLAKTTDVYKNNPDKSKIRNSPELNRTSAETEQAQKQEQINLETQKQYDQKVQENKDKGLLNFTLYLGECILRIKPDPNVSVTREIYDQCKSEYDNYLKEKGVTWNSLNP